MLCSVENYTYTYMNEVHMNILVYIRLWWSSQEKLLQAHVYIIH